MNPIAGMDALTAVRSAGSRQGARFADGTVSATTLEPR